jgi:hypothetical protein
MSKVRTTRSTPPVARTVSRYLFQSWVRISEGTAPAKVWPVESRGRVGPCGGACAGMMVVRWYFAETGVRRSKMRM